MNENNLFEVIVSDESTLDWKDCHTSIAWHKTFMSKLTAEMSKHSTKAMMRFWISAKAMEKPQIGERMMNFNKRPSEFYTIFPQI